MNEPGTSQPHAQCPRIDITYGRPVAHVSDSLSDKVYYVTGEPYTDMHIDAGSGRSIPESILGPTTRAVRVNGQWLVPVRAKTEHDFYESQLRAIRKGDYVSAAWKPVKGMFEPAAATDEPQSGPDIFGFNRCP